MFGGLKGGLLELISNDDVYDLHLATLEVLEKTGVLIREEEALKLFNKTGAEVDFEQKIVRIPSYLTEEAVRKAPRQVRLCARNPKYNIKLGDKRVHFATGGTPVYTLDLNSGERRPSTLKDVENFAKLADALDYMHIFHPCCNPEDVPQAVRDRYRWQASFNYTEKHVMSAVYSVEALKDVIEMASSIVGGMDELMKNPIMSVIVCSVAPLRHDTINTQILMHCAKNKIPVICSNDVMAGASGPATLAGTIVVTNAETLSGVCLTQLVNPGSPVLMGNVSTIMDMRAGTLAEGAPEQILINLCMAQLSHHYRLPYYGTGGTTDAKIPDAQAGWEKGMTALATALVGSNIVHAFGGLLNSLNLASFEQLVIDDEIAGYITRILRGLDKSSESMALEVIHNVGPGGNFLTTKHTREKWKKAQWMPSISSRIDYERWKKEGAKDAYKVAREKALRILKEHQPTPLEEDVKRKITHIIKEAQQKRRM